MAKSIAPTLWEKVRDFFTLIGVSITGDDKGIQVLGGQFSVGSVADPRESIFGGGDSTPVDIAFHYDATTQTGLTIPSATDISIILQSDAGSSVTMFATNTAEQVIMIGEDLPPTGVKSKWDSLGVLESDRVIGEYLRNDDVWATNTYMITGADYPYQKYSSNIASELNEQLRFGESIVNPNLDFELKTLNINGVDYTKYWVRIRLVTPVTTLPVLQQVKSHTSRTEINADGVVEFFGRARGIKTVDVIETANQASDPLDEDVTLFTGGLNGGISKLVDNEFSSNALDSKVYLIKIDQDIDTSTSVLLTIPFYVNGTGTGDIDFYAEEVQLTDPFFYGTLVSPDISTSRIVTIASPSNLKRQLLQFEIPINNIDPNVGGVYVVVSRDARVGNLNDTLSDNIILTGSNVEARKWRL